MMLSFTLSLLLSLGLFSPSLGRPDGHLRDEGPPILVIAESRSEPEGLNYNFMYELNNGVKVDQEGREGPAGASVITGSYTILMDDGTPMLVKYTADENGFIADSPIIPTPHPLPQHAIEQIAFARTQDNN